MTYHRFEELKTYSKRKFCRTVGIKQENFSALATGAKAYVKSEQERCPVKMRGKKSVKLTFEDKILLTLYYIRNYPSFLMLGSYFGISESYANKIYNKFSAIFLKVLRLPGKNALFDDIKAVIIDVTEQRIERPVRRQRRYYSGKAGYHTIKAQLIADLEKMIIISVICRKGRMHDFRMLKESGIKMSGKIMKIADTGYQGIDKLYSKTATPYKRSRKKKLTQEEKDFNRMLAKIRIKIEHINRRCKIFRAVKEIYRGKHRNYNRTWALVAALVNLRYAA